MLSVEGRAAIKGVFEEAKSLGNQAYAEHRYDDALSFYQQAQRADPQNTTQMLHAVLSNMSAVYATQGNWRKSFHHVRCAHGEKNAPFTHTAHTVCLPPVRARRPLRRSS